MSKELVVIEPKNVLTLFTQENQLDEIIKQIEMEVATFEHDLSNDSRRKKTASLARKVSSTKTYLDDLGKDLVSDWKSKAKVVDANRKQMRDRLDELRDLARKPLTDWEEEDKRIKAEEAEKAEAEKLRVQMENDHEVALLMNEKFDRELAEKLAEEYRIEKERQAQLEKERLEREARIAQEAKEKAEREAKEREEQIKREAEEAAAKSEKDRLEAIEREEKANRAAIAAEERAKAQQEEAERQRVIAEEKAKREAEEAAERAKQAEIQRQKDEQARIEREQEEKKAKVEHSRKIQQEMMQAFVDNGLDDASAKLAVEALVNSEIPHIGNVIY